MGAKILEFDQAAREKIRAGVQKLARAVKVTFGPKGRNAVIDKGWGSPNITKDGVTVAEEVELRDPYENMGAQLVKEAASKTSDVAGDGTTTSTVLAEAIFLEAYKYAASGANVTELNRGIRAASDAVVEALKGMSKAVGTDKKSIQSVATIAANGDVEVGKMIAEAMDKVGKDGVITVEESNTFGIETDFVEGMRFDKGYISPYFVTDPERMEAVLDDAYLRLVSSKISAVRDLVPVLEKVMQAGKPLVIVAEDIEGEALSTLVVNKIRGTFRSVAVKAPGFGERRKAMLQDMAILTGAQVISEDVGLKLDNTTLDLLGTAKKIVITKENTTIIEGAGSKEDVLGRINLIKAQIDKTDSNYDREKLQERLAKLSGGVAVIKVGASTETELKEKKHRYEDALSATRAAVEEGIVAGGGVTLLAAAGALEKIKSEGDELTGINIVRRALEEPLRTIAENAGLEGSVIVERVRDSKPGFGLNAATGEIVDLVKAGIVDPAKVTRSTIQNAASIAGLVLTTEALVVEKPEPKKAPAMPGGGMGDMDF